MRVLVSIALLAVVLVAYYFLTVPQPAAESPVKDAQETPGRLAAAPPLEGAPKTAARPSWPREATLAKPVEFEMVTERGVVKSKLPEGTKVKVAKVRDSHLELEYGEFTAKAGFDETDFFKKTEAALGMPTSVTSPARAVAAAPARQAAREVTDDKTNTRTMLFSLCDERGREALLEQVNQMYVVGPEDDILEKYIVEKRVVESSNEDKRRYSRSRIETWGKTKREHLRGGLIEIHGHVSQALGGGSYLVHNDEVMVMAANKTLQVGDMVTGYFKPAGTMDIKDAQTGEKHKIPKFKQVIVRPLTPEEFEQSLRAGKEYQFLTGVELHCPECAGGGFVFNDPADRLTPKPCPMCGGTKRVTEGLLNVVRWE